MPKAAWDPVGNSDVLGHAIVKHKTGQNVSQLVDTLWSYFDVDKNETTYCFGKRPNAWNGPTQENLVRFQLNADQLREIFYADHHVETDKDTLEADEGEPWLMAWKGMRMSHYYVREHSKSKIWKEHANEVRYKHGFEAGHTPRNPGELPKPFEIRKNKLLKKLQRSVKAKPTVEALNTGNLHFL